MNYTTKPLNLARFLLSRLARNRHLFHVHFPTSGELLWDRIKQLYRNKPRNSLAADFVAFATADSTADSTAYTTADSAAHAD